MRRVVIAAVVLSLLAGCDPTRPPPESASGGGWDGTKYTRCDVPNKPPPGKVFGPRPGFLHILLVITADRFEMDSDNPQRICKPNVEIPFTLRLNATLDRKPAIKPDAGQSLPWTANLLTPHFEHFYIPLTAVGQTWEVIAHAVSIVPHHWIRCSIFVDGTRAHRHSARLQPGGTITTASCHASGPV